MAEPALSPPCVILTRPEGRNEPLASMLRRAGLTVRAAPALAIHFLPGERPRPEDGDLCLFVSRQAVDAYFSLGDDPWPAGAWACAVGAATRRALLEHVPSEQVLAPADAAPPDSESLLEVLAARRLVPARAFVFRAQHGRDWLGDRLASMGWRVSRHALYRREPVVWHRDVCEQLASGQCILLLTSAEAINAIDASLGHHDLAWPVRLSVVTLHTRIARRLQYLFADGPADALRITVSAPDETALFQAILTALRPPH